MHTIGSHRHTWTTGAVTGIAAGSSTAGHILALRNPMSSGRWIRLRSIEVEFILTTAFAAAQEVGLDAYIARKYTAPHTGATELTMTGGVVHRAHEPTALTGRIADTGALTAGAHALDANAFLRGSAWCSAVGHQFQPRLYEFKDLPNGGLIIEHEEGFVIRNTIAMGANGVGKWHFTVEFDDTLIP